uniref:Uncharacterized protein n=1 Tax=Oryza brachyantha TaxID=4533 RepID=J3MBK4_ORYBR
MKLLLHVEDNMKVEGSDQSDALLERERYGNEEVIYDSDDIRVVMESFASDIEVPDSQVTVDVQVTVVVRKELHGAASAADESELEAAVAICEKVVYMDVAHVLLHIKPPSWLIPRFSSA